MSELLDITLAPVANINFSASSDVEPVPTPEPGTLGTLLIGFVAMGAMFHIKHNRHFVPHWKCSNDH